MLGAPTSNAPRLAASMMPGPPPVATTLSRQRLCGAKAPPRLLAMWDSVLIAYEDRSRILPDEYRPRVIMKNGDFLPSFLVDGHVAGLWRSEVVESRTRIHIEPFDTIPREAEQALEREAERMAVFVEPIEPNVYKRYASTWMKRG